METPQMSSPGIPISICSIQEGESVERTLMDDLLQDLTNSHH